MKILIHALGVSKGGAMRHLTNFLPILGVHATNHEYTVLVREDFPDLSFSENIFLERVPSSQASAWINRISNDVFVLPRRLSAEKFSTIVSLTNFGPIWSPVPHIFFQRNPTYYCHYYLNHVRGKEKLEVLLRRKLALASMQRADLIVTPSHAMSNMIRQTCPQTKDLNFRTLYHGFSMDSYQQALNSKISRLVENCQGVKMLYPTHPGPHKGFHVLFEILSHLKKGRSDFTLISPISREGHPKEVAEYERQIQSLGLQKHVLFMGSVPQQQMGALYQLCDLMVYPSLCESFGFSMVEAMGHALPIVAAGTDINREMCGEGALYYDALNPIDGAKMIQKALEPSVSKQLQEGGRKRLNSFDWGWQRYVCEFVDIVESVI